MGLFIKNPNYTFKQRYCSVTHTIVFFLRILPLDIGACNEAKP
jgi:hypothetical protein